MFYSSICIKVALILFLRYGLSEQEAINRGYVFKTNPKVKIFSNFDFGLKLAINTAQYGRVFQDR